MRGLPLQQGRIAAAARRARIAGKRAIDRMEFLFCFVYFFRESQPRHRLCIYADLGMAGAEALQADFTPDLSF